MKKILVEFLKHEFIALPLLMTMLLLISYAIMYIVCGIILFFWMIAAQCLQHGFIVIGWVFILLGFITPLAIFFTIVINDCVKRVKKCD